MVRTYEGSKKNKKRRRRKRKKKGQDVSRGTPYVERKYSYCCSNCDAALTPNSTYHCLPTYLLCYWATRAEQYQYATPLNNCFSLL